MTILLEDEGTARDFVAARCSAADFERLRRFVSLLLEEADRQNLVSRASADQVWLRHIADSAQLLDHVPRETGPWLDLGSGAGLPGLVLAIIDPARDYYLVESRTLRADWLNRVISALGIENCVVRKSDVRSVPALEAGVISARAFAPLSRLIAVSARFSTTSTHWVLPKGRSARQELGALPRNMRSMFHVEQSVTDTDGGILVGSGKVEIP